MNESHKNILNWVVFIVLVVFGTIAVAYILERRHKKAIKRESLEAEYLRLKIKEPDGNREGGDE